MRSFQSVGRPDLVEILKPSYADLGGWKTEQQLPVVYSPHYNVKLFGLEKLHPFDAAKFEKVKRNLQREGLLQPTQLVGAAEATPEILLDLHTQQYVDALHTGTQKLQEVIEGPLFFLPESVIQARLHKPMRFHTGGTMLAVALAVESGWAINVGGGMHHAHAENGSGWCAYDDWLLGLRRLRKASGGKVQKALYIDLDVHQGNGVARDKLRLKDDDLYILDLYNRDLWPGDGPAKRGIDLEVTFQCGCGDDEYLSKLRPALERAFRSFKPDIVLYNAGTDILDGDPLGRCKVSAEAVIVRDELVWQAALDKGVPICMALSGGYAKRSAEVITRCISHLMRHFELLPSSSM